jgi:hypothetical protein
MSSPAKVSQACARSGVRVTNITHCACICLTHFQQKGPQTMIQFSFSVLIGIRMFYSQCQDIGQLILCYF